MPADSEEKENINGEQREGANVDKIRDILFGSQMRDYEKRFARLEERFTKASESIREDFKKRFDALESFVGQELESLNQRLKTEKTERAEGLMELTRETRDSSRSLEKKSSQLEERLAEAQGDLRARILEQSKSLGGEIHRAKQEVEFALEKESAVLRNEKTDRATLADLFAELSLRLKDALHLPEK